MQSRPRTNAASLISQSGQPDGWQRFIMTRCLACSYMSWIASCLARPQDLGKAAGPGNKHETLRKSCLWIISCMPQAERS